MRNHFKFIVLLITLTVVIIFVACTDSVTDETKDVKKNPIPLDQSKSDSGDQNAIVKDAKTKPTPINNNKTDTISTNKPQYFFFEGHLLGSYDYDGWHSLSNETDIKNTVTFYAKDILNQDSYYVYESQELLGISKQIVWYTEDSFSQYRIEAEEIHKKLSKYGKNYKMKGNSDTFYRIYDLPLKLGDELSNLKIPNYGFHTHFVFGEEWQSDYTRHKLVTNSNRNPFSQTFTYGVEPTLEGKQLLIKLFKENGIDDTIPNFTYCVRGDFDNDDKDEYLMIANNPKDENGWSIIKGNGDKDKVGTFSVVLYQEDNGSVKVLDSDIRLAPSVPKELYDGFDLLHNIEFGTVADLNGDGIFEIIVLKNYGEGESVLAFSQNTQDVYVAVMSSYWI
jgi:hypothetical protein